MSKKKDDNNSKPKSNPPASYTCGVCGKTLTARTNSELGWQVSEHLATHQNQN
jgi:transposase-like protein